MKRPAKILRNGRCQAKTLGFQRMSEIQPVCVKSLAADPAEIPGDIRSHLAEDAPGISCAPVSDGSGRFPA